jgi:DNA polymerase I-like protein with 3'-5' exonuclease and polymerase domains
MDGAAPAPQEPIAKLLAQAQAGGTGFRLCGRAIQVIGASRLSPELFAALKPRRREIWDHLGGTALDEPSLALLATLGVEIILPRSVTEAQTALAEIEDDSILNTPKELRSRPTLIGFDIETAALPGAETRPAVLLKRDGYPRKQQPALKSEAGLDPHRSTVRLAQVYGGGKRCVVIDTNRVPLDVIASVLQRHTAVIHSAGFELRHLTAAGIPIPYYDDTMQATGLLLGVHHRALDDAVLHYLGIELPKGLQRSDWAAQHLSDGQYAYAALDPIVTLRVWLLLRLELIEKNRGAAYLLHRDVTPAVTRMVERGVLIDQPAHAEQVKSWKATHAEATAEFIATTQQQPPEKPNEVRAYLQKVLPQTWLDTWPRIKNGGLSIRASQLRRVVHLPEIKALLAITAMEKLLTSFGSELIAKISPITHRLHPSYGIAATKAGRFSSNNPNVQQMPKHRAPEFRKCLIASPGNVLVIGDFNMMELRAAAAISGDPQMTADFANEIDLHRQQAAEMLHIPYDQVDAVARDHAKPVNFSMIYGAGASGLVATAWNNYGVDLSLDEATSARQTFLRRYATYARWMDTHHTRCTDSGIIHIGRLGRVIEAAWEEKKHGSRHHEDEDDDWSNGDDLYEGFSDNDYGSNGPGWAYDILKYTLCCNAPVQGSCADASMLALMKTDAALQKAGIEGGPVLFVHDEIVLEVAEKDAEAARKILTDCMVKGFSETFPGAPLVGVVSTGIGPNWGDAKP